MSESKRHKQLKRRAAGSSGRTEVPLQGGGRLDAATKRRATEVELSENFPAAASRLQRSGLNQKVLQVPQQDMPKARAAMRAAGVGGTVKNLSGTRRSSVLRRRRRP